MLYNREYRIWLMMLMRTTDPRHISYRHYGAKGIKVCEEWSDPVTGFDAFLAHIGPAPSERHTVDRYPNHRGHYEPNNVRWATGSEQQANKPKRIPSDVALMQQLPPTKGAEDDAGRSPQDSDGHPKE